MKQKMFLTTIALATVVVLSGCGPMDWFGKKAVEKTIESQTGGKVDVNADNKSMTVNGENGTTTVSGEGQAKLPDNFPSDVFVYSDAKIIVASAMKENDSFSVSYVTSTAVDDAFSKYKDELTGNGWTKENELDMGAQGKLLNFKKGDRSVMVTVGVDNEEQYKGKTMVSVVVSTDKSTSPVSTGDGVGGGAAQE